MVRSFFVMRYEDVARMVISALQSLPPNTTIVVGDRVFRPQDLIYEIQMHTSYGRMFVLNYAKQIGVSITG